MCQSLEQCSMGNFIHEVEKGPGSDSQRLSTKTLCGLVIRDVCVWTAGVETGLKRRWIFDRRGKENVIGKVKICCHALVEPETCKCIKDRKHFHQFDTHTQSCGRSSCGEFCVEPVSGTQHIWLVFGSGSRTLSLDFKAVEVLKTARDGRTLGLLVYFQVTSVPLTQVHLCET